MSSPCHLFILRYVHYMQTLTYTFTHKVLRIMMVVEAELHILVFQSMTSYFHVL